MKQVAAFFDIDGTLYREGFIGDLFKMMIKCEIIPYSKWYEEVKPEYEKWDKRSGTYDTYLLKMAIMYQEAIKGHHKSFIDHIVKSVVQKKYEKTYVYSRERIKWHKSQGHKVITISGSPDDLVSYMAKLYDFDDSIGARYLTDEKDIYTGELIPMWDSKSKLESIKMFKDKYDLDLDSSYAYGDTAGDYSMFESVGHPYLINPTRELLELSMKNEELTKKAKIIVERKDVIYSMDFKGLEIL